MGVEIGAGPARLLRRGGGGQRDGVEARDVGEGGHPHQGGVAHRHREAAVEAGGAVARAGAAGLGGEGGVGRALFDALGAEEAGGLAQRQRAGLAAQAETQALAVEFASGEEGEPAAPQGRFAEFGVEAAFAEVERGGEAVEPQGSNEEAADGDAQVDGGVGADPVEGEVGPGGTEMGRMDFAQIERVGGEGAGEERRPAGPAQGEGALQRGVAEFGAGEGQGGVVGAGGEIPDEDGIGGEIAGEVGVSEAPQEIGRRGEGERELTANMARRAGAQGAAKADGGAGDPELSGEAGRLFGGEFARGRPLDLEADG